MCHFVQILELYVCIVLDNSIDWKVFVPKPEGRGVLLESPRVFGREAPGFCVKLPNGVLLVDKAEGWVVGHCGWAMLPNVAEVD